METYMVLLFLLFGGATALQCEGPGCDLDEEKGNLDNNG